MKKKIKVSPKLKLRGKARAERSHDQPDLRAMLLRQWAEAAAKLRAAGF